MRTKSFALIGGLVVAALLAVASPAGASTTTAYQWASNPKVTTPTALTGIPGTIAQVATSNTSVYVLTTDGSVYSWGGNIDGELGDGNKHNVTGDAVKVQFPAGVVITSLPNPMPFDTGMAIDSNGNVWGWGANHGNELCTHSEQNQVLPWELTAVSGVQFATGAGGHALYETSSGLEACGLNTYGELGNGTTTNSVSPVSVPLTGVVALTSSWQGSGALLANGDYYDWGWNDSGQLGNGNTTNQSSPVLVMSGVTQAYQGGSIASNGQTDVLVGSTAYEWGNNVGTTPVVQPGSWTDVASGGGTFFLIDGSGELYSQSPGGAIKPLAPGFTYVSGTAFVDAGF